MKLFDKVDDTRGQTGIGTQLNIWDEELGKYRLFMPLETVPSVVGSTDTVEIDLLTSSMKSKIEGKSSVEDKDVEFLWHRDNLRLLRSIAGEQHKFLVSYPDFTGWGFTGQIKYRPNDASSDKLTGTFTLIASQVDDCETEDVRDLMARTCVIDSVVPSSIDLDVTKDSENGKSMTLSSPISGATFTATSTSATVATATVASNKLTIKPIAKGYCIVEVTSSASGYAGWTTTIAVEVY